MVTIRNEYLEVQISTLGAELQSIKDTNGTEYLWQGDARYWKSRATNLFPFVGRLEGASYTVEGTSYPMGSHGFARDNEFIIGEQNEDSVEFILESNDQLEAIYPFLFKFSIIYELEATQINISYKVKNRGSNTMYCALGGHPGFNVPVAKQGEFKDYYLEFHEPCNPTRVNVSNKGLLNGTDEPYELVGDKITYLNHELYKEDAIILKDTSKIITIKNNVNAPEIEVSFPDMKYMATWKPAIEDAQFLCIEPWSTLPGRNGIMEDISKIPHMNVIDSGHVHENKWWIKIKK